jgi:hypothetical protein
VKPHVLLCLGVKVQLSLYLIKHHAMKTYGGVEVQFHVYFTLALDVGDRLASHSGCFTPRKDAPCHHHFKRDWVGFRVGLDYEKKRKTSTSCQETNPDSWVAQPVWEPLFIRSRGDIA